MKILKIFEEKLRYKNYSEKSMTLVNQKTSILLLSPGYSTDIKEHIKMIVSNDGAQAFLTIWISNSW